MGKASKAPKDVVECNLDKLKELILYIATESEGDDRFGAIKLNKILFYSDFAAYRTLGKSITGAEYQKLGEGPAPRELLLCRKEMERKNEIEIEFRPYFNGVQQRLVARRPPRLSKFSKIELSIVDQVIEAFWSKNGREVSEESHKEYGWRLANEYETIPYSASFFSSEPLTAEQVELGRDIAERHGLVIKTPALV
jgi:hypothetical protein